jgi:hypothetical protein
MPAALEKRLRAFLKHSFRENPNRYLFANRNGKCYLVGKVTEYGLWPPAEGSEYRTHGIPCVPSRGSERAS